MALTLFKPEVLLVEGRFRSDLSLAVSGDGRIAQLGGVSTSARTIDLPGRVLLPGLVNAHSHAFQRMIRGRTEFRSQVQDQDTFWTWRERMYRAAAALGPEELYVASRQAFVEMALAGIEFGSHTCSHPQSLVDLNETSLHAELRRSRRAIEAVVNAPAELFSYPHGRLDRRVETAVAAAGYRLACAGVGTRFEPLHVSRVAPPQAPGPAVDVVTSWRRFKWRVRSALPAPSGLAS